MKKNRLIGAVLAGALATGPAFAEDRDMGSRDTISKEAAALFRVILSAETKPARCQYGREWERTFTVPEYFARDFFGLALHADLSSPETHLKPTDLLDPQHVHPEAFCTKADKALFRKDQFAAFEKGAGTKRVTDVEYSFPVFDANYVKAAVVTSEAVYEPHAPPDVVLRVNFYEKAQGTWKLLRTEVLGLS